MTTVPHNPSRISILSPMKTAAAKFFHACWDANTMQSLDIQGFTYEQRNGLLPDLTSAFSNCGGWIIERKTISPTNMEFRVEIQLRSALDLYAAIVATGVELTRSGHEALTELCSRRKHLQMAAELGQIVAIRMEISFLDDVTLHSLLAGGAGLA
jgi:hypothetical protein